MRSVATKLSPARENPPAGPTGDPLSYHEQFNLVTTGLVLEIKFPISNIRSVVFHDGSFDSRCVRTGEESQHRPRGIGENDDRVMFLMTGPESILGL